MLMSQSALLALPSLALVLGLIWLAGHAIRRGWIRLPGGGPRMSGGPAPPLAIVQTLAIDTRRRLHLVRCEGGHVLLLTGGTHDALLGWPPDKPGPA